MLPDLALKLCGFRLGLHSNDVGYTLHALHLSYGVLGGGFLILPLDRAVARTIASPSILSSPNSVLVEEARRTRQELNRCQVSGAFGIL
jgi:hypothetical protein